MDSRTLVKKALTFDNPSRTPRQLWHLQWAEIHHAQDLQRLQNDFPSDFTSIPWAFAGPLPVQGDPHAVGEFTDEWGCTFINRQAGIVGEVKQPLVSSWSDLDKVSPPEIMLTQDIDQANQFCRNSDKFVLAGCCPRPFERLQFLRGTENVMMDLALAGPDIKKLLQIIHDFYLREIEMWCRTKADGIAFMDDWGSQNALLISPDMWREWFKPLYTQYINLIHDAGKFAFMHSDGNILAIYPDLIDIGLDALNSQIFCMGLEKLAAYKGEICFWGEIDRQHILPQATTDQVAQAVRDVYHHLWENGGCIAQCEFGPAAKPENVYTVFATWDDITTA